MRLLHWTMMVFWLLVLLPLWLPMAIILYCYDKATGMYYNYQAREL